MPTKRRFQSWSSRVMKKGVAAALRRHYALKSLAEWRGKPAAASRPTALSSVRQNVSIGAEGGSWRYRTQGGLRPHRALTQHSQSVALYPTCKGPPFRTVVRNSVLVRSSLIAPVPSFFYNSHPSGGAGFHRFDCSARSYGVPGLSAFSLFDLRAAAHVLRDLLPGLY
jgi:hypothetical protein